MGYREQQSAKQFMAEEAAREREAEERRLAPIREAERKLKTTAMELHKIERENVSTLRDEECFISPELVGASMTRENAEKFNVEQINLFMRETPEYGPFRTPENADVLLGYFTRNGISIADVATIRAAFYRLRDLGLLTARETPQSESETVIQPRSNAPQRTEPETFVGRDPETGCEKTFTLREVNRMGSEEYKRTFPVLLTFAELLTAMKTENESEAV